MALSARSVSFPPIPPIQFQKAMVFIDGTNFLYRFEGAKTKLDTPIASLVELYISKRQLVRVYFYTSPPHLEKAKKIYAGSEFKSVFKGVEIVLGSAIPTGDGNHREKGVDALLVADLIYHAAMKNYDYALVLSTDQDFAPVIKRVQDFGCKTVILSLFNDLPENLENVCDESHSVTKDWIISQRLAVDLS